MTQFRAVVVVAFLLHCIGLFVLPKLPFLFSAETIELMKYGGHGARLAMDHGLIFALYLLPYPAYVALYFFKNWGRHLLLFYVFVLLVGSFFFGASVSGPPETFVAFAATLLDGAILGLSFLSPLAASFTRRADKSVAFE